VNDGRIKPIFDKQSGKLLFLANQICFEVLFLHQSKSLISSPKLKI